MFKPDTRTVVQFFVMKPVAGSSQMSPSSSTMSFFLPVQLISIFDILQQNLLDITKRLLFRSTQCPYLGHFSPRSRSSLCALPHQSLQSFFFFNSSPRKSVTFNLQTCLHSSFPHAQCPWSFAPEGFVQRAYSTRSVNSCWLSEQRAASRSEATSGTCLMFSHPD